AERLALLGMELRSGSIFARYCSGYLAPVIGDGQNVFRSCRIEVIGMHEIGVQAVLPCRDSGKKRMVTHEPDSVPADLRNLQRRVGGTDLPYIAGDPAEALCDGFFQPALRHQLHADADAQKGPGPGPC